VVKSMQLEGAKCKMSRGPTRVKGRPNRAGMGLGRLAQAGWPGPFLCRFAPPPLLEPEEDGALKSWRRRHSQRERVIRPRDRPEAREEEEDRHHIRNEELSIVYHL
jgi:hypothetical protein